MRCKALTVSLVLVKSVGCRNRHPHCEMRKYLAVQYYEKRCVRVYDFRPYINSQCSNHLFFCGCLVSKKLSSPT